MDAEKLQKMAYLLARLEQIGFRKQAEILARNHGIVMWANSNSLNPAQMAKDIKKALEKDLSKAPQKYKKKKYKEGNFWRVDPKDISDEEKAKIPNVQQIWKNMGQMPEGGMAELDFMKRTVPKIRKE